MANLFVSTFNPTDAQAQPGSFFGTPTWSSDTPAVATVTQSTTNPLQATVTGIAPGTCNVTISIQTLEGTVVNVSESVIVTGGDVTGGTFSNTTPA